MSSLPESLPTEVPAPKAPPPAKGGRLRRWTKRLVLAGLGLGLLGVLGLASAFWYYSHDLPSFSTLEDYRPLETTRIVSRDGKVVGELFKERRTVVPFSEIPKVLVHAVVAAEDDRFFEHEGLDYAGILRAAVKNVLAGRVKEGASTITQQVVKTFLLSPERRFSRKFREMILARRLEQNLSKDEILYLYLNQIYFGHGRYGVEEASRYYFGKHVKDLSLGEAAILAGLPRAPAFYSPRRHPKAAKKRQRYVLGRMVANGFVTRAEADAAAKAPIVVVPLPEAPPGAWYVEEVRRRLEIELGPELLLGGGLTVDVAMDARLQAAAEKAVRENLEAVDRRQGWRGPLARLDAEATDAVRARFESLLEKRRSRDPDAPPVVWDLADLASWDREARKTPPVHLVRLEEGARPAGLVTALDPKSDTAVVSLGELDVRLSLKDMRWARRFDLERHTDPPLAIGDVLEQGDVVRVRVTDAGDPPEAVLFQRPEVEGALVAIDPRSRDVLALVGGYDPGDSAFDRATQARRQPGSSFKPFVYGTALDSGRYTPMSRVLDAPAVFRDPWNGSVWKPENAGGRYDGELALRTALARSKNVVSVRLVSDLGVDAVIDFARRAGIESDLPRYLPLALGAGEVTPLEEVNAYATLAAGGVRDRPALILEVRDRTGRVLRSHQPQPQQTLRPEVCYVLADMMTSVLKEGTARRLNHLGRPAAVKTGTANDQRDAWLVGFTPELVAGAWVGFDNPRPLGPSEYGARAAGPAWLAFMKSALEGTPQTWFDPPEGVTFVRVDPDTGLLARPGEKGRFEPFVSGTEPTRETPPEGHRAGELLLDDPNLMP